MAHDHRFRFGVQVGGSRGAADWSALARKVEDFGYSTLFMPDHFVDTELAPMVGISFAAAATERLRVGMLVLGNDYKHPAVTAKEAATVDLLSGGRLEFGIGAGWMQADYDALGLTYDSAKYQESLAKARGELDCHFNLRCLQHSSGRVRHFATHWRPGTAVHTT